ncbi:MAG: hypothetical protein E7331_05735 [Clostridiales bacterium]|nr:hypothetical protein [Clostridiales bacterium]
MRNYIADPTSSAALGAFDRELKRMHRDADRLLSQRRSGCSDPREEARILARYKGSLARLLRERLEGEN